MTRPPGPRFPRTGGPRDLVEVLTSYLNLADQVTGLRVALADLGRAAPPIDKPEISMG